MTEQVLTEKDLQGIDYGINPKDLIIDQVLSAEVRDDSSGAIGSVGHSDVFFNDEMVEASQGLDAILGMDC